MPRQTGDTMFHPPCIRNPRAVCGCTLLTRYKRRLCVSVSKGKVCPYGRKCIFAHSSEEIAERLDHIRECARVALPVFQQLRNGRSLVSK